MKTSALLGLRVEFLRDASPAVRGDVGVVTAVRTLPGGHDVVVVQWQGKSIAIFKSEIRLVDDPTTATGRLTVHAPAATNEDPARAISKEEALAAS
jgi:hypothetical protein